MSSKTNDFSTEIMGACCYINQECDCCMMIYQIVSALSWTVTSYFLLSAPKYLVVDTSKILPQRLSGTRKNKTWISSIWLQDMAIWLTSALITIAVLSLCGSVNGESTISAHMWFSVKTFIDKRECVFDRWDSPNRVRRFSFFRNMSLNKISRDYTC